MDLGDIPSFENIQIENIEISKPSITNIGMWNPTIDNLMQIPVQGMDNSMLPHIAEEMKNGEKHVLDGTKKENEVIELDLHMDMSFQMESVKEIPIPVVCPPLGGDQKKEEIKEVKKKETIKTIYLFDVDGTLCLSGQPISMDMVESLQKWKHVMKCDMGLVCGGNYDRVQKQMGESLSLFRYLFLECGSVVYENGKLVKKNMFIHHPSYKQTQKLIKHSLRFIAESNYEVSGHFVDIRNGLIYISLVGMQATPEQREKFIKMDRKLEYRKRLWIQLQERKDAQLEVVYGGEVGLSIYPKDWDKVQCLKYLGEYGEIHFFGDRYDENGNDYQLLNHPRVIGHPINSLDDVITCLRI
jgi:phosphomannomutase